MPVLDEIKRVLGNQTMSALSPEKYAEPDGFAHKFIQEVGTRNLKPTQLRRVFHYIKDLYRKLNHETESFNRGAVAMIMPQLAYAKGRDLIPGDFYELMKLCFGSEKCQTLDDFNNATNFLEALMAYHKYEESQPSQSRRPYGGR